MFPLCVPAAVQEPLCRTDCCSLLRFRLTRTSHVLTRFFGGNAVRVIAATPGRAVGAIWSRSRIRRGGRIYRRPEWDHVTKRRCDSPRFKSDKGICDDRGSEDIYSPDLAPFVERASILSSTIVSLCFLTDQQALRGLPRGAMTLSILEGEIYFEYVEARVCQNGGCEARAVVILMGDLVRVRIFSEEGRSCAAGVAVLRFTERAEPC